MVIRANPSFNAESAAERLRKAMKGIGTNEDVIIEVTASHNNAQRLEILKKYKAMYGRDLISDFRSELSGKFLTVIKALYTPHMEYLAECINNAVKGLGTDEKTIIELLCCRSNSELESLKHVYKQKYSSELEDDLRSDLSGDFKRIITAILAAGRDENAPSNFNQAQNDARELYTAGIGTLGTDESTFYKILNVRSYSQLRASFEAYEHITGQDIEKSIKKEFSGDVLETLLAIVRVSRDPSLFFAKLLHKAMKGLGTDDMALIRLLVTRSEPFSGALDVDIRHVREKYRQEYGKSLADTVKSETSGDYRKMLLKLIEA